MIRVGSYIDALRRAPLAHACASVHRRFTTWFVGRARLLSPFTWLRPKPELSNRSLLVHWIIDRQSGQTVPLRATSCWVINNKQVETDPVIDLQVRSPHRNQVVPGIGLQVPSLILLPLSGLYNHEINVLLELRAVIASYQLPVVLLTTEDPDLSSATLLELHEAAWSIRYVDPVESIRLLDTLAWQGRLPFLSNP